MYDISVIYTFLSLGEQKIKFIDVILCILPRELLICSDTGFNLS